MTTAGDYTASSPFGFQFTQEFTRKRRKRIVDPYDPDNTVFGDWSDTDDITVPGGIASLSSTEIDDAVRSEAVSTASFVCDDPNVDVQRGDRIIAADGRAWLVIGYPTTDRNVFTGWRPTLVANLQEVTG